MTWLDEAEMADPAYRNAYRPECSGTSQYPRERWGADSPVPRRGTCRHCGQRCALTMAGFVRSHRVPEGSRE